MADFSLRRFRIYDRYRVFCKYGRLRRHLPRYVFLGLDMALFLMGMYAFPLQAVFDNKIAATVKSALLLSVRHPGWTALLLALHVETVILA